MNLYRYSVTGFDDLQLMLRQLDARLKQSSHPDRPLPSHIIFVYFTDSKLSDGSNWCEDSAKADPIVWIALDKLEEKFKNESLNSSNTANNTPIHWVNCQVGARDYWYNPNNPFRRDRQLRLHQIPALLAMFKKGGEWADWGNTEDMSQIYEKEEHFGDLKAVEGVIDDFLHMASRFAN
ncbi:hypothetical protein ACQ4LE_005649 [Meloidogyne hapla]